MRRIASQVEETSADTSVSALKTDALKISADITEGSRWRHIDQLQHYII